MINNSNELSGVPKKNVPQSHKKFPESCLSRCAVSKYEALFGRSFMRRFLGHPIHSSLLYNQGVIIKPIMGLYGKHSRGIEYHPEDYEKYIGVKPYYM